MTVLDRRYRRRSALQAFACPRHFKGVYVDGLQVESHPARRGTAFHEVIRQYINLLVEHPSKPEDDGELSVQALRVGLAASQASHRVIQEVTELWQRFVPTFHLDHDALLMHEEQPDDEYDWRPDLVRAYRDVLEITDFKTHFVVLSEDAARAAFQVAFYSARARQVWPGFGIYRFSLWFVRWGVIVHVELSQADIDRHEEQLGVLEAGIATALQTQDWPAVPGETCLYCPLACDVADNALLQPVRIQTWDDAERRLGEYLVLDQAAKARRDALELWAGLEGPVRVGGLEFSARPTQRTEFPIDRVLDVFRQHQLEPSFSVSRSALKRYLTQVRHRHIAPDLEAVGRVFPGSEYRVRKVDDVAPDSMETTQ